MLQTVDPPFHNVSGMARTYLQFAALCNSPTISTPGEATSTYQNYRTNPAANKLFEINNLFARTALRLGVQPAAVPTDPPGPTVAKPLLPFARDPARQSSTVLNFQIPIESLTLTKR